MHIKRDRHHRLTVHGYGMLEARQLLAGIELAPTVDALSNSLAMAANLFRADEDKSDDKPNGPIGDDLRDDADDRGCLDDELSLPDGRIARPLGLSNRLTLSFAPDGTSIFDSKSNLFAAFAGVLTPEHIQAAILAGFQMWAAKGNLDVGLVADSGDPFGIAGRPLGDSRFGDVRLGAVPLGADVYAIAMGQGDFVSGTWAGDILFNSNATFRSPEHFLSVALHEIGHVLGLDHVSDADSIMNRDSTRVDLSQLDVANFQKLYGDRNLDAHERHGESHNNSRSNATEIQFGNQGTPLGKYPALLFGDIHRKNDIDYFKFESPDGYTERVTFRVISQGISLLAPRISVYDQSGRLIGSFDSESIRGDAISIAVSASENDGYYFIAIDGGAENSVGRYALVTQLEANNALPEESILAAARNWDLVDLEPEEIARYFQDPENFLVDDDSHYDDERKSVIELRSDEDNPSQARFRRVASLSDAADVDVYKLKTMKFSSAALPTLNVSVRSTITGGMIPQVAVFDSDQNLVPAEILVNGRGEFVLQVPNVRPESKYFIHVSADDLLPFVAGNYELNVSYSSASVETVSLARGNAQFGQSSVFSLHVAESKLMHFALEAAAFNAAPNSLVWATIYDQAGSIINQIATRPGQRRSADTVYFQPGSYLIEVTVSDPSLNGIAFQLLGVDIGDGQGPSITDPSGSPFEKDTNGNYIYPDDVVSQATYVVVDGVSSNQTPPPPPSDQPPKDLYYWYWGI